MSEGLNTTDYKSFHYLENGTVEFSKINTNYTRPRLDVGIYDIESNHDGSKIVTSLKVSDDKEKFNQDISFYFEDKIDTIYHSFFNTDIKAKINALGYNINWGFFYTVRLERVKQVCLRNTSNRLLETTKESSLT